MRVSLCINSIEEDCLLHPVAAITQIQIKPEDLLLTPKEFCERYLLPAYAAARNEFMYQQERAAENA